MRHPLRRIAALSLAVPAALAPLGTTPGLHSGTPAQIESVAPDSGRPVVILVHGRGQILGDSAAVRAQWSRVLQTGVSTLAGGELLREGDVRVAWYADALDPLAPAVCDEPPSPATSGNGAADEDAQLREFFAAAGAGITAVLDLFDGYARDEARAIAGDLLFLGDPLRKCAAERQLENAIARARQEGRPVILVAHSFGSLLAYGYLRSQPDDSAAADIRQFVTIGSLLGAPGARKLFLGDSDSLATLPPGVQAWTNIVETRDALAYPILFDTSVDTTRVRNLTTTPEAPGADPHDVVRYLRDPVTLRVLARAFCGALAVPPDVRKPSGCASL
jgi:hypothetical protein